MRILIATGGAPHSHIAVRLGGRIAAATNSPLPTLLTVIRHESDRAEGETILAQAQALLAASDAALTEAGEPSVLLRQGAPAEEIIRAASEGAYDLLVMGEKPEHGFVKRLLGPTSTRVIAQLPCPVLIARRDTPALRRFLLCEGWRDPLLLRRLIHPLAPLMQLAQEMTLLHVMSQMVAAPGVPGWELRAEAAELMERHTREGKLLQQDLAALQGVIPHIQPRVRHGLVVDEIVAEADEGDYDLVVIGAHQGEGWARLLLDDITSQIMSQTDRSVLVV
ncbi:MAG: universal stress protein [Anaerolineales bacterium]|nr:universal stress protein [Anaerolineales bacterium]MCB8952798.1 universal stress protein [Ardenticatenales bacterium]